MAKRDKLQEPVEASEDEAERRRPRPSPPPGNGLGSPAPSITSARDRGAWLILIGMAVAALLVVVLVGMPGARPAPAGTAALPDNEFTRIIGSVQGLLTPSDHSLPVVVSKLVLAALLGAIIGYRQRLHVEEYIIQAHVIISFTGALMMIIIGNEIVRAFGLLGAGSIVRYRTPVRDPKALASLFVTMAIGIAVGTNLFELALVGAVLIVALQGIVGHIADRLPPALYNPQRGYILDLTTADGGATMIDLKDVFAAHDIRYKLMEFDQSKKHAKLTLKVEAPANMTTEQLTLLVLRDGVESVSWEEDV